MSKKPFTNDNLLKVVDTCHHSVNVITSSITQSDDINFDSPNLSHEQVNPGK